MAKFVVDAYAWIEYLDASENGRKIASIVEAETNEVFTSTATVAEIVSKFLRNRKNPGIALTSINTLSGVVNLTQELAINAAHVHVAAKKKARDFGMLDAFVAATAKKLDAKILTGDPHFKGFRNAILV